MLPVNCGSHADYQNFVVTNLRKYYPDPNVFSRDTWGIKEKYKEDFTIGKDGVPVCKAGRKMNHDGFEPSKARLKFRCPLASRKYGCSCSGPCSDSKYGMYPGYPHTVYWLCGKYLLADDRIVDIWRKFADRVCTVFFTESGVCKCAEGGKYRTCVKNEKRQIELSMSS